MSDSHSGLPSRRTLALLALALLPACAGSSGVDVEGDGSGDDALTCSHAMLKGVDVSDYQLTVDWHAVHAAGFDFAYAQAGDGLSFSDHTFVENWRGIRAAGLARGAYQYFEPSQGAKAQADALLARIDAAGGFEDGDLPPALDVETADGESGGAIAAGAAAWAARIEQKLGVTPVVYISPGFYSSIGAPQSLTKMPLWEADWGVSCPSVPSGFHGFTFWQSSESASVPGISGHVDEDRFDGTRADLAALGEQAPAKPKPPTLADDEGTFAIAELDGNGTTDIDGDGKADACAFNGTSINCYLSRGDKFAAEPIDGPSLPADEATQSEFYSTIRFADINGDGRADICARES
ncbi:MAG TPA: GH25 family lysozyme, partial [Byssovorax sp.]